MDKTVNLFNSFYETSMSVSAGDYDVVFAFFNDYTPNVTVARSFTENLFRISSITKINVMELLDNFRGGDSMKVSLTMAYYLNSLGNKTVMYGISNTMPANQLVQRNVVL
jgi:hypothetical protein